MIPETLSFLNGRLGQIIASGGDVEAAMRCAHSYLELERKAKLAGKSDKPAAHNAGRRRQLKLVRRV